MKRPFILGAIAAIALPFAAHAEIPPGTFQLKGGVPAAARLAKKNPTKMAFEKVENDERYNGRTSYMWLSFGDNWIGCVAYPDKPLTDALCFAHPNFLYPHYPLPQQ